MQCSSVKSVSTARFLAWVCTREGYHPSILWAETELLATCAVARSMVEEGGDTDTGTRLTELLNTAFLDSVKHSEASHTCDHDVATMSSPGRG